MIGVAMYTTIRTLFKRGLNKSEIARATGHDWKTVAKVIAKDGKWPTKKPHPSKLDLHKETIIEMLEIGISGLRIHQELSKKGLKVGYSTVKEYIAKIKKRDNIFIRIHTKAAEEVQVDFGYVGYTFDNFGKKRKTWIFNMKMSYSRKDFYKKVYDQRVETFIELHEQAFRYFGGVPKYVRIDNLKAAILNANFYEPIYQKLYSNFATHYGFEIIPCRIYRPNDKGKVESGIKYVKGNFFAGRKFKNGNDVDNKLFKWQENTCNKRIHGTTRRIPDEVFNFEEKDFLKFLTINNFKMTENAKRKVYHDCHIYVKYNYYSVPFEYIGKEVDIELSKNLLKIYYHNKLITEHLRLTGEGKFSTIKEHYPKYKMYSETEYQEKLQVKMSSIGTYAEQLFLAMAKKSSANWFRAIQGIHSLTKKYPNTIVNLACKRALAYGAYKYQTVKNICENGAYMLPVEFNIEEI